MKNKQTNKQKLSLLFISASRINPSGNKKADGDSCMHSKSIVPPTPLDQLQIKLQQASNCSLLSAYLVLYLFRSCDTAKAITSGLFVRAMSNYFITI